MTLKIRMSFKSQVFLKSSDADLGLAYSVFYKNTLFRALRHNLPEKTRTRQEHALPQMRDSKKQQQEYDFWNSTVWLLNGDFHIHSTTYILLANKF